MSQCIDCAHYTLRDHAGTTNDKSRKAAQTFAVHHGFGRCAIGDAWRFLSPEHDRDCTRHHQADPAVTQQRRTWLAAR